MARTGHAGASAPRRWMRLGVGTLAAGLLTFNATGCATTGEGFFGGALLGSLAGLGLGSLSGDAGKGAAAGAIIGGVTGAAVGSVNEHASPRYTYVTHRSDNHHYHAPKRRVDDHPPRRDVVIERQVIVKRGKSDCTPPRKHAPRFPACDGQSPKHHEDYKYEHRYERRSGHGYERRYEHRYERERIETRRSWHGQRRSHHHHWQPRRSYNSRSGFHFRYEVGPHSYHRKTSRTVWYPRRCR